jgi:hypothetical protein
MGITRILFLPGQESSEASSFSVTAALPGGDSLAAALFQQHDGELSDRPGRCGLQGGKI